MTPTHHHVTLDLEGGPAALTCTAPTDALCHAAWDCDCEHWADAGVTAGVPWHTIHDGGPAVTHTGRIDAAVCGYQAWFEAGEDWEWLTGTVTIPVVPEFDGDFCLFRAVDAAEAGA